MRGAWVFAIGNDTSMSHFLIKDIVLLLWLLMKDRNQVWIFKLKWKWMKTSFKPKKHFPRYNLKIFTLFQPEDMDRKNRTVWVRFANEVFFQIWSSVMKRFFIWEGMSTNRGFEIEEQRELLKQLKNFYTLKRCLPVSQCGPVALSVSLSSPAT